MAANVTTLPEILVFVNEQTYGVFGLGFLWIFFLIMLIAMKKYGIDASFASSSLLSLIVASLMWSLGILTAHWVVVFVALTIIGVIILLFRK